MKRTLRWMTCGAVDDGKSTLLGRLLWESKQVFDDHRASLEQDSIRYGSQGMALDMALLMDGLQAEREQKITVDVAYRFFATPRRRFVVADCPGHEQYTRNMATGASNSDLAVLVINVGKGLTLQTHRHARIASLMGIRHMVLAINKMDTVAWSEDVFQCVVAGFEPLQKELGFDSLQAIPLSALHGDNVAECSAAAAWYKGPTLLEVLENANVDSDIKLHDFRMAVQWVNRPHACFRGFAGRIASGSIRIGDRVRIAPGGSETSVSSIMTWKAENATAKAGDSVTVCLEDEIDVPRGAVISSFTNSVGVSDQFKVSIVVFSKHGLVAQRRYLFQLHTCLAAATITAIKYRQEEITGSHLAARFLGPNEVGVANLEIDRLVAFEPYERSKQLGGFLLIDPFTNETLAAGMIHYALRRAANLHWQALDIRKEERAGQKMQRPRCLWLTGLSGSGKSTIANLLEKRLFAMGRHTYILDGDNVRHGLCRDLGFTQEDRVENMRRVMEVASLMVDAGLVTIVAFISPYRAERQRARERFSAEEFVEIFIDAPLEECERRDPKGLYAKARRGEMKHFTGLDSAYEVPEKPDVWLKTDQMDLDACVTEILAWLELHE